jgi:membrane protein insertase Oxa1/YidC/SpoIIIJ
MLTEFWFSFLYQPTLNLLVWIYNNISGQNMGWAVVILTVLLRTVLLPLSIISQRSSYRREQAEAEALSAIQSFKNDPIAQKEEYRKIMKKHRISPWAKVLLLLIQLLFLILLYQVFMGGIFGERLIKVLYQSISFPGAVNNLFYSANLGITHNFWWALAPALYLFISTIITTDKNDGWQKSEVVFLFLFPLFVFIALWILPMVKSLFILTSILFSDMLNLMRIIFFPVKKP